MQLFGGRTLALWMILVVFSCRGLVAHAAEGAVLRMQSHVVVPAVEWSMTPYFDGESLVVHLQKKKSVIDTGPDELLIDTRTGQPWGGDFAALIGGTARRLGPEMLSELANRQGQANYRLLKTLGCSTEHNRGCTLPEDAEVLLFTAFDRERSTLRFETVDLRPLLDGMTRVLAGQIDPELVRWTESDWIVLDAFSHLPEWRERWIEAVRSVTDPVAFGRLRRSYVVLNMGQRVFLRGSDVVGRVGELHLSQDETHVDVRAEMELAGFRLLARQKTQLWLQQPQEESAAELAKALIFGMTPPAQIKVKEHLTDVVTNLVPKDKMPTLSSVLAKQAQNLHSENLRCFSGWLLERSCREASHAVQDNNRQAQPPTARSKTARLTDIVPKHDEKHRETLGGIIVTLPDKTVPAGVGKIANDVPQEVVMVNKLPNKVVLVVFDEVSGRMSKDMASLAGLTFVARSLGTLEEGRFEVQMLPAKNAPVLLSQGRYRARVRFMLDYTREDRCRGDMLNCLLAKPLTHAKTEQRDVVFYINPGNKYSNTQPANFGTLLPLIADGGEKYSSNLKAVRLSVKDVRLDLE